MASVHAKERKGSPRVSLACLACRYQHLRCNAARPACSRCTTLGKICSYPEPRRSGKLRAASKRRAEHGRSPARIEGQDTNEASSSIPSPWQILGVHTGGIQIQMDGDLQLYYTCFHPGHPFILPWKALQARAASHWSALWPLIKMMKLVGSFYNGNIASADDVDADEGGETLDGFVVQKTLLMALMKSMCNDQAAADILLNLTIQHAMSLGMHLKAFADACADSDTGLAESWRRTWWMISITDTNFAIIRRDFNKSLLDTEQDIPLPCEESIYEQQAGFPRTAETTLAYRNREFAAEERHFSSFAYFIDATSIYFSALRATSQFFDVPDAESLCEDFEANIASWFLLLPNSKCLARKQHRPLDQLIFEAYMMMYTASIFIHRPLSNIQYDPVEARSSCTALPSPMWPKLHADLKNDQSHTEKIFESIRDQNQCLVALPLRHLQLSPFVLCTVACGTVVYILACKYAFGTDDMSSARSRIRVSLGTLKPYGDIWPRGEKVLSELKAIARSVLEAETEGSGTVYDDDFMSEGDMDFNSILDDAWLQSLEDSMSY